MKLLAFSDLHRDQDAAQMIVDASKNADFVIGAGDFATRREGMSETLEILKKCLALVILVHGNHDDPIEISQYCESWQNGYYLHGNAVTINGQSFFGLGGEIPPRNPNPWNVAETEAQAAEFLSQCADDTILITHTPPLGIADLQRSGQHEGSAAILAAATNRKPKLILCGHIHNSWGMHGRIGSTRVYNLGPTINWFDV